MSTSLSARLRRTRIEEVHVSVPVTSELICLDAEGKTRLDVPKVFAAAIELGSDASLPWRADGEPVIELHHTQTPPPNGR